MLSNNWMAPVTDEADRDDPAYDIRPGVRIKRVNGIWEASHAGACIMCLDYQQLIDLVDKLGWTE